MKKTFLSISLILSVSTLNAFSLGDVSNTVSGMQNTTPTQTSKTQATDLTGMLTSQLGVTDKQASGGVGSILSYAKSALPQDKYSTLSSAIPNADSLLAMAPSVSGDSSSSLGALSGMMGGNSSTSGLATLTSQFSSLGLSSDMIGKFVPVITSYLKGSGSNDAAGILSGLFN